ncbi:MAG: hypothetical protein M1821_001888 [Bathelium mastoideum]|nr:MAG: hypothetical protein M1821_001888 [Bathelium mastoideum]
MDGKQKRSKRTKMDGKQKRSKRTGPDPIAGYLNQERERQCPPSRLISLPPELRQRILLNSMEESDLESESVIKERAVKPATIHSVFRQDMDWVQKQWLLIWKQVQERNRPLRELLDKWAKETMAELHQLPQELEVTAVEWGTAAVQELQISRNTLRPGAQDNWFALVKHKL